MSKKKSSKSGKFDYEAFEKSATSGIWTGISRAGRVKRINEPFCGKLLRGRISLPSFMRNINY